MSIVQIYLLRLFNSIPRSRWCKGSIRRKGQRCAIGHLIREPMPPDVVGFLDVHLLALVKANDAPGDTRDNVIAFLQGIQ